MPRRWTVLVWMAGDNDLEGYVKRDLAEMKKVGSTDEVAVVAQADRLKDSGTLRYYVTKGGRAENDVVEELGETNTGDPAVAADFFRWGMRQYAAERVLAVLWNHGSGIDEEDVYRRRVRGARARGLVPHHVRALRSNRFQRSLFASTVAQAAGSRAIAYDDTSRDFLDTMELTRVLKQASDGAARKIDLLGFDACLMGMFEIAYQCAPYAEALVGAQEVEPLDGWPYDRILGALVARPGWTAAELGRCIVEEFVKEYAGDDRITQSALDLSVSQGVADAIDELAGRLLEATEGDAAKQALAVLAATRTQRFETPGFLDLGSLCAELKAKFPDPPLARACDAVTAALRQGPAPLVLAEQHSGPAVRRATGASIYLPLTRLSVAYDRLELAGRTRWGALVREFSGWVDPDTPRAAVAGGRRRSAAVARAAAPLRVLAIHGISGMERDLAWQAEWRKAFQEGIGRFSTAPLAVDFLPLDDIFERFPLTAQHVAEAAARLGWSGLLHGFKDSLKARGLGGTLRWTAGMVVQWASDEALRAATRRRLLEHLAARGAPALVAAHSLGSLIAYDTFGRTAHAAAIRGSIFFTFGSQIGSAFVRGQFAGHVGPLQADYWYHAYNPHDPVFTAPLTVAGDRFRQLLLDEDRQGFLAEHEALVYLRHAEVVDTVFRDVAASATATREPGRGNRRRTGAPVAAPSRVVWRRRAERRALLVGINEYPNPADRLDGCVNDVYLVSAALQELGIDAKDVRIVLNDRATAAGLRERIEWLLDGVRDGDSRVLYFSGHGAQLPGYGSVGEVDRVDECLAPWDFDWTPDRAIVDDWFNRLYSSLPYESQLVAILDCCHSGGMARAGGAKVRGLTPPDDIRHRALRWRGPAEGVWAERTLELPNRGGLRTWRGDEGRVGSGNAVRRLGRAIALRWLDDRSGRQRDRVRRAFAHRGPYMPVLMEACAEHELAYEYSAGTARHGAFTYFLVEGLRAMRRRKQKPSFRRLVDRARVSVGRIYQQTPQLEGPGKRLTEAL